MSTRERRIALIGALLGAFASAYLLVDYVFGSGICLTGSGCDVVRASAFAYPLGIPMPLLGLAFYLVAAILVLRDPAEALAGVRTELLTVGWSVLGALVMSVLTVIELFVIGAVCSWCLMSAVASGILLGGTVAARRRQRNEPAAQVGRSSAARRRSGAEAERSRRDLRRFAGASAGLLGVALLALLALPALTLGTPVERGAVGASDRPVLGHGPVEVVVFSDFQCPACAVAAPVLAQLADERAISLTYRYFPLVSIHPNATPAAEAAEAASRQDRFWDFHDALFANQKAWADLPAGEASAAFTTIATQIGLDLDAWRGDLGSTAVREMVADDARAAADLRLTGTPTIFIDGVRYGGPLSYSDLRRAVDGSASER